jgi:Origin of replication binding protein
MLIAESLFSSKASVRTYSLKEAMDYMLLRGTGFEVIATDFHTHIHPFFDLDYRGDDHAGVLERATDLLCEAFAVDRSKLAISMTHYNDIDPDRLSVHFVLPFEVYDIHDFYARVKHPQVVPQLKACYFDTSIYSSYRKFRMLWCSKEPGKPVKEPTTFTAPGEGHLHLVTYISSTSDIVRFDEKSKLGSLDSPKQPIGEIVFDFPRIDPVNCDYYDAVEKLIELRGLNATIRGVKDTDNGRFFYLETRRSRVCCISGETHERNNLFLRHRHDTDGVVFYYCLAETCAGCFLPIGKIVNKHAFTQFFPEISYPDRSCRYQAISQQYLPDLELSDQCSTIVVKSEMGTGKTTSVVRLLRDSKSKVSIPSLPGFWKLVPDIIRVLVVTSRISLAHFLAEALSIVGEYKSYKQIQGNNLGQIDKLVIEYESLGRLGPEEIPRYDLIICDEWNSLTQSIIGKCNRDKLRWHAKLFQTLLRCARYALFLDADMNDMCLQVVSHMREPSTTLFIENKFKMNNRRAILHRHKNTFVNEMKQSIERGEKIYICSTSKQFVDTIIRPLLEITGVIDESLVITKDSNDLMVQDVMAHPERWANYKVLVFTPRVCTGIDFSARGVFHRIFVYQAPGVPQCTSWQMMGRVRHPIDPDFHVHIRAHTITTSPLTREEVMQHLESRSGALHDSVQHLVQSYTDEIESDLRTFSIRLESRMPTWISAIAQHSVIEFSQQSTNATYRFLQECFKRQVPCRIVSKKDHDESTISTIALKEMGLEQLTANWNEVTELRKEEVAEINTFIREGKGTEEDKLAMKKHILTSFFGDMVGNYKTMKDIDTNLHSIFRASTCIHEDFKKLLKADKDQLLGLYPELCHFKFPYHYLLQRMKLAIGVTTWDSSVDLFTHTVNQIALKDLYHEVCMLGERRASVPAKLDVLKTIRHIMKFVVSASVTKVQRSYPPKIRIKFPPVTTVDRRVFTSFDLANIFIERRMNETREIVEIGEQELQTNE